LRVISAADMREICEAIIALESTAAELLAEKPDGERLSITTELESVNAEMEAALDVDDLAAWARADGRFHQLLIERCGNKRLARMFHTIMDQSHRARMLTLGCAPNRPDRCLSTTLLCKLFEKATRPRHASGRNNTEPVHVTNCSHYWISLGCGISNRVAVGCELWGAHDFDVRLSERQWFWG
jgi:FCD domain-containing protein